MGWFRRNPEARMADGEVRDPKAATVQIQTVGRGQAMTPRLNADRAVSIGYLGNVVAYRCIEIIAQVVAGLPFRAGAARPDGVAGVAPYNEQARLARLLGPGGTAASGIPAATLWSWLVTQRVATGRAACEIEPLERGDGIAGLWPLTSARLDVHPTKGGARPFAYFEYGPWHDKRRLSVDEVFYTWEPHPDDYRQPKSALLAAQYDLSIALQSDRYREALLCNNEVPDTLFVIPEFPDVESEEAFKRQWRATHRGAENAGKAQFFTAEADAEGKLQEAVAVHRLGMSPKDSKLIEQHRESLQHIAIALGVPWSRLDASGRTFDNAKQEDLAFWQDTMLPLLSALEGDVNAQIAPRCGPEVGWFDLSNVDALRPSLSVGDAIQLYNVGLISDEEVRLRAGFAGPAPTPMPDDPPTEVVPDDDDPGAAGGAPAGAGGEGGRGRQGEGQAQGRPSQEGRVPGEVERRVTPEELKLRRDKFGKAHDAILNNYQPIWRRKFAVLFERQRDATIKRLTGPARGRKVVEGRASVGDLFDPAFWQAQTAEEARTLFDALATGAFTRVTDAFGISFDLEAEFARDFIEARVFDLSGRVTTTTYEAIRSALAEGVAEGEGIPDLARRIEEVFDDAVGNRAEVIARTEVNSAFNAATNLAGSTLPSDVAAARLWVAARDGRTRESHAAADGQVVPMSAPFQVGGASMFYPGDPSGPAKETVQCRCALAILTPAEAEEYFAAQAMAIAPPIPLERARVALALVEPGRFDEARFRAALEVAA